jgi:hypothetical protein
VRRHGGFGDVKPVADVTGAHWPTAEQLKHLSARRIGQSFENPTH